MEMESTCHTVFRQVLAMLILSVTPPNLFFFQFRDFSTKEVANTHFGHILILGSVISLMEE